MLLPTLVLFAHCLSVIAVDSIIIKGNQFFFQTNGSQFFARGISYPSPLDVIANDDLLSDPTSCLRDIPFFSELNINVLDVAWINPNKDHDLCMNALAAAGIYTIVRLDRFASPWLKITAWSWDHYDYYSAVVDSMAGYNNTLAFISAQTSGKLERSTKADLNHYPPIKASIRDVKQHIRTQKYRDIPVGFVSHVAEPDIESRLFQYMACDEDNVDFVIGKMLWQKEEANYFCLPSPMISRMLDTYAKLSVPVLLEPAICDFPLASQFQDNHTFFEIDQVFNDKSTLAGGIFAQYFLNDVDNLPGLMKLTGKEVEPLPGYATLSSKLAKLSLRPYGNARDMPSPTFPSCPKIDGNWKVATALPPAPTSRKLCSCMMKSLKCRVTAIGEKDVVDDQVDFWLGRAKPLCDNEVFSNTTSCTGIMSDRQNGYYGSFSICNQTESLSWALNRFYMQEGTCKYPDLSELRDAPPPDDPECAAMLQAANEKDANNHTIASQPSATPPAPFPPAASSTSSIRRLSSATIAGIVVSLLAALAMIGGGVFWLLRRRRRARIQSGTASTQPGELAEDARRNEAPAFEPKPIYEAPSGYDPRIELPADMSEDKEKNYQLIAELDSQPRSYKI